MIPSQTKFLYWVLGWVIVGCQCYQISWQLQSGQTDNQLSPNIRVLFGAKTMTMTFLNLNKTSKLFDNDMIWYSESFVAAQHVFRLHVWSINLIIFMSASHDFCFYHSSCQQSCVGSIYFAKKLCQLALVAMDPFFMKIGLRTLLFRLPTQCVPLRFKQ